MNLLKVMLIKVLFNKAFIFINIKVWEQGLIITYYKITLYDKNACCLHDF